MGMDLQFSMKTINNFEILLLFLLYLFHLLLKINMDCVVENFNDVEISANVSYCVSLFLGLMKNQYWVMTILIILKSLLIFIIVFLCP